MTIIMLMWVNNENDNDYNNYDNYNNYNDDKKKS